MATALLQVTNVSHLGGNGLCLLFPCESSLSTQQPARVIFSKHKADQTDPLFKSLHDSTGPSVKHNLRDMTNRYVLCPSLRHDRVPPSSAFPCFLGLLSVLLTCCTHSCHCPSNCCSFCIEFSFCLSSMITSFPSFESQL